MLILGIEASSLVASAAVVSEETLIAEYTLNHKKTHSQTLLPMLKELLEAAEIPPQQIDAVAVSGGPGSFTGLRIGAATAKGLCLALEKPLVPVPTLAAMAYGLHGTRRLVCPILDARRGQVYTALYRAEDDLVCERKAEAVSIEKLIEVLKDYDEPVIFTGDGIPVFAGRLSDGLGALASFAPPHLNRQRAGAVAALGAKLFAEGQTADADLWAPEYLRVSQAEREFVQIRECTEADLDTVEALEQACFVPAWTRDMLESSFSNPADHCLLAERRGEPAAFCVCQTVLDEAEIQRIAVLPKFRRQGIAGRLLSAAEAMFPEVRSWNLEVRESNAAALALYGAAGYRVIRRRKNYYDAPEEDALCLQKTKTV